MASNSFGRIFILTSFGESHGEAIGGVIDGCPAGLEIDFDFIKTEMERRRPGQSNITTSRNEEDNVEFLSGIFDGKSTGTPIGFIIRNADQKSKDYESIKDVYRPSHADYTYQEKYGLRDYRGGGRASARETAVRVVGGAIAKLILKKYNITVNAWVSQIGSLAMSESFHLKNTDEIYKSITRCPEKEISDRMLVLLEDLKKDGDSIGGMVCCSISNVPAGLGEPVFDKLSAALSKAVFSIPAVHGFEYGSGFKCVSMKGSDHNDLIIKSKSAGQISTTTNHSGGIVGGISNGMPIEFRVAFKPASSISKKQKSIQVTGEEVELEIKGRHDPCVAPRAVAVVEAMASMVLVDSLFMNRMSKL